MDEFLGKVKDQAAKAKVEAIKLGKQVYDRTNTAIAITKLSFAINETDSKIKESYEAIGRMVYDKYLSGGEVCDFVKESCAGIDELFAEREALKEKKAELKNTVVCGECGEYNKEGAAYCSKCGAKLSESDAPKSEAQEKEDFISEVVDEVKETASEMKEKTSEVVDEVKDAASEACEKVEETVRKVIKIKPRKPADE